MNRKDQLLEQDAPLLVIIGPSAAGKTSVVSALNKKGLIEITPTWTDRPTRPGEVELEHVFVSKKRMDEEAKKGTFMHEPMTFFNLPYRYAMPKIRKPKPGKIPTVMMRAAVIPQLSNYHTNFTIYQIEGPLSRAEKELMAREAKGVPIGTRLKDYEREVAIGRRLATKVFSNHDLRETIRRLEAAVREDFDLAKR